MALPLPKGYLPPAYSINEKDHGGLAMIASGIAIVVASIVLLVRLPLRTSMTNHRGGDDWAILFSTVR